VDASLATSRRNITAILVEAGAVTRDQVVVALARQQETGRRIGEALVELGFVSEEDIGWALAHQLGIPFVDVRPDTIDIELVRSFPEGALRRLQAVPLFRSDGRVTAAFADPTDVDTIHELERLCDAPASCVAATPSAIEQALDAILGRRPGALARASERAAEPFEATWDRSGDTFLAFHLKWARRLGALEVHFVCADGWLQVMHRAAPRVNTLGREPAAVMDALVTRFESLGMEPLVGECHRVFQASCDVAGVEQAFEVSLLATRDQRSATVRLLRDRADRPRIDALGFEPLDVAQLRERLSEPAGLVLVSGPPHSGVRTTLAALLAEAAGAEHRWAVFARERQPWPPSPGAPEIVTGSLAADWQRIAAAHSLDGMVLDSGLEGRRVRAALASAAQGRWLIGRTSWEDSFEMLAYLARAPRGRVALAHRLRAVIQQRLVATPRANAVPSAAESLTRPGAETPERANGAPAEPLRRAVFEVLFASDALREAILAGADAAALRAVALRQGFVPLADGLKAQVQRGRLDPRDSFRAVA
jgi:type II secretory ATPase GspE/PulE/Tfp pilus assembly ATPase PilB-like protein